jgi:hypothetical protein
VEKLVWPPSNIDRKTGDSRNECHEGVPRVDCTGTRGLFNLNVRFRLELMLR